MWLHVSESEEVLRVDQVAPSVAYKGPIVKRNLGYSLRVTVANEASFEHLLTEAH